MKTPAGKAIDLAVLFGPPKGKGMAKDEDETSAEESSEDNESEQEELSPELKTAAEEAFPEMTEDQMKALKRFVGFCMEGDY